MCRPCSEESLCLLDADWTSERWESIQREIKSPIEVARQRREEKKERKKDSQMTQIEETTAPECTDLSDVPQASLVVLENPGLAFIVPQNSSLLWHL